MFAKIQIQERGEHTLKSIIFHIDVNSAFLSWEAVFRLAHSQEKRNYAGTPSVEFNIGIELQSRFRRVKLIYYQSENRWVLNFRT